jgi:hypothetical protein
MCSPSFQEQHDEGRPTDNNVMSRSTFVWRMCYLFGCVLVSMNQVPYTPLIDASGTCADGPLELDSADTGRHRPAESQCRHRMCRKQDTSHTPLDCVVHRCDMLDNDVMRLKDHDTKSRIQIKQLEMKIATLEEAIQGLTAPKQTQAAPFNFSSGQKLRNPFKKALSIDVPAQQSEVNYDNILPPKRSTSRERVGLFGSLGASSQQR